MHNVRRLFRKRNKEVTLTKIMSSLGVLLYMKKKKDAIVPTIATSMGQIDVNPRFSRILRSYSCPEAFPFGWLLETCRLSIGPEKRTMQLT